MNSLLATILIYTGICIIYVITHRYLSKQVAFIMWLPIIFGGCIQGCREYDNYSHWALIWWISAILFLIHFNVNIDDSEDE